jgi:hypothetical protein
MTGLQFEGWGARFRLAIGVPGRTVYIFVKRKHEETHR